MFLTRVKSKAFTLSRQSIVTAACSGKQLIPLIRYVNKAAILIIALNQHADSLGIVWQIACLFYLLFLWC